jgi:hypothetical protein
MTADRVVKEFCRLHDDSDLFITYALHYYHTRGSKKRCRDQDERCMR